MGTMGTKTAVSLLVVAGTGVLAAAHFKIISEGLALTLIVLLTLIVRLRYV
jgi:hypothetical protein